MRSILESTLIEKMAEVTAEVTAEVIVTELVPQVLSEKTRLLLQGLCLFRMGPALERDHQGRIDVLVRKLTGVQLLIELIGALIEVVTEGWTEPSERQTLKHLHRLPSPECMRAENNPTALPFTLLNQ